MYRRIAALVLMALCVMSFAGCGNQNSQSQVSSVPGGGIDSAPAASGNSAGEPIVVPDNSAEEPAEETAEEPDSNAAGELPNLDVRFGRGGSSFVLQLYDNDTAAEIARLVGQSDWNLPIYNYDDFEGWEYMQYYDIPSRYDIPSNPESVTSAKAGEVYYSHPNRIILFYHDAEITAEYTPVGHIDSSQEFIDAVESNPVLEGWGNKIISISRAG